MAVLDIVITYTHRYIENMSCAVLSTQLRSSQPASEALMLFRKAKPIYFRLGVVCS